MEYQSFAAIVLDHNNRKCQSFFRPFGAAAPRSQNLKLPAKNGRHKINKVSREREGGVHAP